MGLESYDLATARTQIEHSLPGGAAKERAVVADHIADGDIVSGRFYSNNVADLGSGTTIFDGAVLLTANNALYIISSKGSFRVKYSVERLSLSALQNRVVAKDADLGLSRLTPVAAIWRTSGAGHLISFVDDIARDGFVHELQQHLLMWSMR